MTVFQWLTVLGVPTIVIFIWRSFLRQIQNSNKEMEALKAGLQALLRNQMIQDYNRYSERGYAPMYARESFENCWKQYHALGANGVIDDLHDSFLSCPYHKIQEVIMKIKITEMLAHYADKCVKTDSYPVTLPAIGYVMGGDGRVATDAYVKSRAKSSYPASWEAYYNAYKKWIGRAVLDCNAVAEAYYKQKTGVSIDTKAKYNYSDWCGKHSPKTADKTLAGLPQMRGVAVFSGGETADKITHVGFLFEKYSEGDRDWYVLECRGKDYGLVLTTLNSRPWAYWGVMDKYFEYESEVTTMKQLKLTSPMMRGDDIRALQVALNALGYPCGTADGVCGKATMAAVAAFCANHAKSELPGELTINGAKYAKVGE